MRRIFVMAFITVTCMLRVALEAQAEVGVKTDDWIKYDYLSTPPETTTHPIWIKLEILSVEETNVTFQMTMHLSNGTEQSQTGIVNVGTGTITTGNEMLIIVPPVIPANSKIGDSMYGIVITGETTRNYAGVRRIVVYSSFYRDVVQFEYYWDKQTGIIVEGSGSAPGTVMRLKTTETNMWSSPPVDFSTILYALLAIAMIALFVLIVRHVRTRW
jgi:hypothetical protein